MSEIRIFKKELVVEAAGEVALSWAWVIENDGKEVLFTDDEALGEMDVAVVNGSMILKKWTVPKEESV